MPRAASAAGCMVQTQVLYFLSKAALIELNVLPEGISSVGYLGDLQCIAHTVFCNQLNQHMQAKQPSQVVGASTREMQIRLINTCS